MARTRKTLLKELVDSIVREWGYAEVRNVLLDLDSVRESNKPGGDEASADRSLGNGESHTRRQSAEDYVSKRDLPDSRKQILLNLASLFDRKSFLTTAGDLKQFLLTYQADETSIRSRDKDFPKIARVLENMSDEELDIMLRNGVHYGPSRLGPISEAIKETALTIRSQADTPTPEPESTNLDKK